MHFEESFHRIYATGLTDVEKIAKLKELYLDKEGFLVDFFGIRYKRNTPIATIDVITGTGVTISEIKEIRKKIINLEPEPHGFLRVKVQTEYRTKNLPIDGPDGTVIVEPRDVPYEVHTLEFYHLGE